MNAGLLDGAFALSLERRIIVPGSPTEQVTRYIFAMVGGRPVVLTFDLTGISVSEQAISSMRDGFRLGAHAQTPPSRTFEWTNGRVELALPDGWELRPRLEGEFRLELDGQRLSVHRGTDDGLIWPCGESAAPWDVCEGTRAASLQELADFVMPDPIPDHGVSAPRGVQESGTLDGEPSIVVRIHGYEYPARGGQTLTYVVAFHHGRPYVIRLWSPRDAIVGEAEVIAGFQFTE